MNQPPYQNRPNPRPQVPEPQTPPKKIPAFEVVNLRLIEDAGSLQAYASVRIGPLVLHDFRVIQQGIGTPAEQEAWVSVPQKAWNTPQGERKFSPLLEMPREWKQPLTNAVISAWLEERKKQQGGAA